MQELTSVALLGVLITSFGWLLHEMHRLRDLIAEVQKDAVATRMLVEYLANDGRQNEPRITRIKLQ